jgi:hypothetical protein
MMDEQSLRDALARARERSPATRDACPSPDELNDLATTAGDSPRRLEQLSHVATCGACRADFDLLRTAAQSAPAPRARRAAPWMPALAAAALLAIVSAVVLRRPADVDVMRGGDDTRAFRIVSVSAGPDSVTLVWTAVPEAVRYDVEALRGDDTPAFSARTQDTVARGARSAGVITRFTVTATLLDGTTRSAEAARR